jgi:hypothetical protein
MGIIPFSVVIVFVLNLYVLIGIMLFSIVIVFVLSFYVGWSLTHSKAQPVSVMEIMIKKYLIQKVLRW